MDNDYLNYCRLCMGDEHLKEMDLSTINKIRNEFSIEVLPDGELSREICSSCDDFLSKYVSFKVKVNKTQELLRKILGRKKKDVNNESTATFEPVLTEEPSRTRNKSENNRINIGTINLLEKPSNANNKNVKRTPERRSVENVISLIEEPSKKRSKSPEPLQNSNVSTTEPTKNIDTIEDSTKVSEDLIIKIIKSINMNDIEENDELKNWNPQNPQCDICRTRVNDLDDFRKHMNSKVHIFKSHVIKKLGDPTIFNNYRVGYTCKACGEIFSSKLVMCLHSKDAHKKAMNKNRIMPDTIILKKKCEETSSKIAAEELVVKEEPGIPENQKSHPCRFCNKSFGFIESLSMHHKKHHKDIFLCMHCSHVSKSRRAFVIHLREHYALKYSQKMCSSCFKICETQQELANHRKEVHEGVVFICPICDGKFPNSTALKKHKRDVHRAHNDELEKNNTFMCKRCNRSFLSALVLEKHQCVALKYTCLKKCHKRFETFSEMQRHSVKCTLGTTIYKCQYCKKSLKSLSSLQRHMLKCSTSAVTSNDTKRANTIPDTEKNRPEICPNPTQPRTEEISSKNHNIHHQSSPAQKKIKTSSSEQLGEKNVFNCKKCFKKISSIEAFDLHTKKCKQRKRSLIIRTKKVKKIKRLKSKKPKKKTSKVKIITNKNKKIKEERKVDKSSKISKQDSTLNNELACRVCGIVLKSKIFLSIHLKTFHKLKTPLTVENPPTCLKTPMKDKTPDLSKGNKLTPLNLNYQEVHSNTQTRNENAKQNHLYKPLLGMEVSSKPIKSTPALDLSCQKVCLSTQTPPPAKIEKTTQNLHLDNQTPSQNKPTHSSDSSTHRIYPERSERTRNYDHYDHYKPNTNKFFSSYGRSPVSPATNVNQRISATSAVRKTSEQITIISNSRETCVICRNTAPHLFCSPCARCFHQNQVQYLNHMRMKHSGI